MIVSLCMVLYLVGFAALVWSLLAAGGREMPSPIGKE